MATRACSTFARARGFTVVELLLVILMVSVLSMLALPIMLDYRKEARMALAMEAAQTLGSVINMKHKQMMIRCGTSASEWPNLTAINANNIVAGGQCNDSQVQGNDQRFLSSTMLNLPDYKGNGDTEVVACLCANISDPACFPSGRSYCYWEGKVRTDPEGIDGAPSPSSLAASSDDGSNTGGGTSTTGGAVSSLSCTPGASYGIGNYGLCYDHCTYEIVDYVYCNPTMPDQCNGESYIWDGSQCFYEVRRGFMPYCDETTRDIVSNDQCGIVESSSSSEEPPPPEPPPEE